MVNENIEDKLKDTELPKQEVQTSPQTEDITDKLNEQNREKGSDLEQKTNTFFSTLKQFSLWDWMKISAAGAAATALSGGFLTAGAIINVATTVSSYGIGTYVAKKKEGMSKEDLKSEFYLGAGMTPVLYKFFKTLDGVSNPFLQTTAALSIGMPIFNFAFLPIRYMFKNYSKPSELLKRITYEKGGLITLPFEIYKKSLKGQYWKSMVKYWKVMTLPVIAMLNLIPMQYMLPASSVTRMAYKYFMEKTIGDKDSKDNVIPMGKKPYPTQKQYLDKNTA